MFLREIHFLYWGRPLRKIIFNDDESFWDKKIFIIKTNINYIITYRKFSHSLKFFETLSEWCHSISRNMYYAIFKFKHYFIAQKRFNLLFASWSLRCILPMAHVKIFLLHLEQARVHFTVQIYFASSKYSLAKQKITLVQTAFISTIFCFKMEM